MRQWHHRRCRTGRPHHHLEPPVGFEPLLLRSPTLYETHGRVAAATQGEAKPGLLASRRRFIGLCFAVGGFWDLLDTETSVVPIVLIIAGGALPIALFRRRNR